MGKVKHSKDFLELQKSLEECDVLIVGSGLYGLTVAELASRVFNMNCVIIEKRAEIGGNAHSYFDSETGIEVHKYGSHLFHTNSEKVYNYIRRFTRLNSYIHRVYANYGNRIYTLPFNLLTLNQVYGKIFTPTEAKELLATFENPIKPYPQDFDFDDLETKAIKMVGKDIYERLIEGYTYKQWQLHPSKLPANIISRLPVRTDYDDRYFSDKYQGLPVDGYANWFEKMIQSPRIKVFNEIDYFEIKEFTENLPTVYTGAIDRFFDYNYGTLGWRTLDFVNEKLKVRDFQGTSVMNYPDKEIPFTRIHEFRHLHPEREYPSNATVISREFSRLASQSDEPYYPINSLDDRTKLKNYRSMAKSVSNVHFGGRLGSYLYLDMHMAIGSAIQFMESEFENWLNNLRLTREF